MTAAHLGSNPSLRQIIWTDYAAFINTVLLVMVWVIYLAWVPSWRADGPIISPAYAPYYLGLSILISLICLSILVYRVLLLRRVLQKGDQVQGRISFIEIRRDRGQVEYVFLYKGEECRARCGIHRTKQTLALRKGERVNLVVDPGNPKRAFIRDLYT